MTKGSTLKHMNMDTTVPTAASEVAQNSSQVSVLTNKGDSGDCDTLTRKKPSEEFSLESLESLDLNSYLTTLPNWKQRGSPWKNIPFHFSSSGVHPSVGAISSSSVVNHADGAALSSSYAMECDDTSSNTLEGNNCSFGLNSGVLGAGVCQNPLVVAETEAQQGVCKCAAVGAGGREGERSKQGVHLGVCVSGAMGAVDAGLGDMVDAVFASSGSNSPLSSSSPNQDDDTSGGLFTADEGREGDDELSEGDDGSSVCGLPCAVPWWEEGEMDGTDDATHRPQFPSQLQHILDGIKAAVTTEHTTAGGTIADSHTINSLLKSSAANLLNPSIPKRALPAPDKKGPDLLFLDNSSESYEHLTSPDGSSKSKRSRYSASLMNAAGLSSRHRYSKFHSGKYRKKRRRSYSAGENKNRPTSSMSNFRFNKGGQQGWVD